MTDLSRQMGSYCRVVRAQTSVKQLLRSQGRNVTEGVASNGDRRKEDKNPIFGTPAHFLQSQV